MNNLTNRNCPLSEEFFYWPPEEINRYKNWCEASHIRDKQPLPKAKRKEQMNKHKI